MTAWRAFLVSLVIVATLAGGAVWFVLVGRQADQRIDIRYTEGAAAVVPLGIQAGMSSASTFDIANPLAGDATAIAKGKHLYRSLNCAGCHGYTAKGNMGPNLTDPLWRYGGRPVDVYKSIYEGRPKGMPAWGNALPPQSIWQIAAYIQSLGGTRPHATPAAREAGAQSNSSKAETGDVAPDKIKPQAGPERQDQ